MEETSAERAKRGGPRRPDPVSWRGLTATVTAVAAGLAAVAGVSLLLGHLAARMPTGLSEVDSAIYRAVAGNANQQVVDFILVFLNDPGLDYTVAVTACVAYTWLRRREQLIPAVLALSLSLIVSAWTDTFTLTYGPRPRPFVFMPEVPVSAHWRQVWLGFPSFPSGHVRELTGLTIVLTYFWRRSAVLALPYLLLVGGTRVYVGAHYPTDVVGGLVAGGLAGAFSVLTVHRLVLTVGRLGEIPIVRRAYDYLTATGDGAPEGCSSVARMAVRSGLLFMLLLGAAYMVGYLLHIRQPAMLAGYMRDTDNVLTYSLVDRFEPTMVGPLYWIFVNPLTVLPALAATVLALGIRRGRKRLRIVLAVTIVALVAVGIIGGILAPHFAMPRPFSTKEAVLFGDWPAQWAGPASYPDWQVTTAAVLSATIAVFAPRIRLVAYGCALLSTLALVYFGAVWVSEALGSLLLGYLAVRYGAFVVRSRAPASLDSRAQQTATNRELD